MDLRDLADMVEEELARTHLLQMQNDLELTSGYYRSIIQSSDDAIIGKSLDGIITSWNPAAEKMFGYSAAEAIGQPALMLLDAENHQEERRILAEIAKCKAVESSDAVRRHKNGKLMNLAVTISPITNHKGVVLGASTIARDMSRSEEAESKLRDSESRIRAIVENVIDGIITIDSRGIVQSMNAAAEKIFAYDSSEVIGENVKMLMPETYSQEHDGYLSSYLKTGVKKIIGIGREVEGRRKDGTTFPMELAVSDMMIDGDYMFAGVVRDITERKKMERMKSEFVSTVSHELRTPLTSIRGALGLVLAKFSAQLPANALKMIEMANRNGERLTLLINDILDLEKIESGHLDFDFKLLDLAAIARSAVADNQGFAEQHGVQLLITDSLAAAPVLGDENRLLQVFANLISNAIKYSPEGGRVEVNVGMENSHILVSVRDYGDGIPFKFRDQIFQRFAQADSSDSREKGGTGLGLSICKAIMDRHQGSIDYRSTIGEGTEFSFTLPCTALAGGDDVFEPSSSSVLICENDPLMGSAISQSLKLKGITSDLAATAAEVEALLSKYHYRLVVLDLELPGLDDRAWLNRVRSSSSRTLPAAMIITGQAQEAEKKLAGSGIMIEQWIDKPVDEASLTHSVIRVLSRIKRPQILHVEDDRDIIQVTQHLMEGVADFTSAPSVFGARRLLAENHYDLAILDLDLMDGSGLDLLQELKCHCPVVIFSAQIPPQVALQADAALVKSMTTNEQLKLALHRLIHQQPVDSL